jgi:hypothetical protein
MPSNLASEAKGNSIAFFQTETVTAAGKTKVHTRREKLGKP